MTEATPVLVTAEARRTLDSYTRPDRRRALWQLANTLVPCLALWVLMFLSLQVSYWITLGLSVLTAAFQVRTFIIFHDCGHGSFFGSRRANEVVGFFTGVMTLTPYHRWWGDHGRHHATTGNLDRHGVGDVWMMTSDEYARSSWPMRLWYRVYRHPFFMFIIGPFFVFGVLNRVPSWKGRRHEILSVLWTNLALVAIWVTLAFTVGIKAYLMVQVPVLLFSGIAGLWLFYIQHNYEHAYWKSEGAHDYAEAAMLGSSVLEMPRILHWFSGNIGFHHIHHLSPRIPNYFLDKCHYQLPEMPQLTRLSMRASLASLKLRLWDEATQRMICFREFERRRAAGEFTG